VGDVPSWFLQKQVQKLIARVSPAPTVQAELRDDA